MPAQLKISNPFLQEYLKYVEHTESPRLFHIWAALSGVSACMGRRVYLPFGIGPIFPNMFVLLVGPPAVRKSTAATIMKNLLLDTVALRLAPDDTGGQHQGLIAALENRQTDSSEEIEDIDAAIQTMNLDAINRIKIRIDARDKHTLYAIASGEFGSFMGSRSLNMVRFLAQAYDGEDYEYRLKNEQRKLREPLLSILGATTPTDINETFPRAAVGQGFMSRIIFVYGAKRYRRIARPRKLNDVGSNYIRKVFRYAYEQLEGPMSETDAAIARSNKLYEDTGSLNDPRFIHYIDRRHIHRIKLAMSLAAGRFSRTIDEQDYLEADHILCETEQYMASALGEYGFSPLSSAKQQMLEFLQHNPTAVPEPILWALMSRNMSFIDFKNSLLEMVNAGKVKEVSLKDFPIAYVYRELGREDVEETLELLTEPAAPQVDKGGDNVIVLQG